MKPFRTFLRKIDIFGVSFNFKYKTKDKYSTSLGGFTLLIFSVLAITFGVYYFIPFLQRKNLSIIYYTMNIPKTENISLKDSQAAFSIGFECEDTPTLTVDDVFKLDFKYVVFSKNEKGIYDKVKSPLSSHNCKYEDFYNEHNNSFDYLNLKKYQCLDDYNQTLEGIFSDQVFSYYEFSVTAKDKTDLVDQYLKDSDCKLQMYYTDITIDIYDYKEPIRPFLNSLFIQLNPTLYIKRNVYFMNQYLYNDDTLITVFDEEQKPKQMETLFSRYEEYALYLGLDRETTKPTDLEDYAKIYIRADTKQTEIRRTYQKLTEFYADASSLLIAVYDFLNIIISIISNFYAEEAVIKKLFIFKEMDDKFYHFSKKIDKIQELVTLTNENIKDGKKTVFKKRTKNNNKKVLNLNLRSTSRQNTLNNLKNMETIEREEDKENPEDKEEKKETIENKENKEVNLFKRKTSEFNFNICEIIAVLIFPCCLRGHLKFKNDLNEKANNILYNKLNIILYVRNMILLDILNKTLLDDTKKDIINFLSRPIITLNYNNFERRGTFYKAYIENDFDKFYNSFSELVKKPNKKEKEKRLINFSKTNLMQLV